MALWPIFCVARFSRTELNHWILQDLDAVERPRYRVSTASPADTPVARMRLPLRSAPSGTSSLHPSWMWLQIFQTYFSSLLGFASDCSGCARPKRTEGPLLSRPNL
jgi:hypothetical protein